MDVIGMVLMGVIGVYLLIVFVMAGYYLWLSHNPI